MLETLSAIAKALLYMGALSGAGFILALASLRPTLAGPNFAGLEGKVKTRVRAAAGLALLACLGWMLLLFFRLGGEVSEPIIAAMAFSPTGWWAALLTGGSLMLLGLGPSNVAPAVAASVLMLAAFGANGHVPALGPLQGLVAFVHVAAAAWWLGALFVLRRAAVQLDAAPLAALVKRFGRVALGGIAALALAGVVMVILLVDFSAKLWLSPYWQLLALKLVLVLGALGLAAYNRLRLTPRIAAGDRAAAAMLQRSITGEIVLITLALITMATLTTWTSPHG